MFVFFTFFYSVSSFDLKLIPRTGSPPIAMISSAAVYDNITNTIYSLGGDQTQNNKIVASVHAFNLDSLKWQEVRIESNFIPNALTNHAAYLRSDRKILTFGYWSEVLAFNIESHAWSVEELKGDQIGGLGTFAFTVFTYNLSEFAAIYGGMRADGYSADLFLIDVYTLVSKKLPNNINAPIGRIGSTMEYFNGSLYIFGYQYSAYLYGLENGSELYRYDLEGEYWEIVNVNGDIPIMRLSHYSAIYNGKMYVLYGIISESLTDFNDVYQFEFENKTWTYLGALTENSFILSAKVQVNNFVYLLYGRSRETVLNSLIKIDLDPNPPTYEYLSVNYLTPSERVYHCSFVINEKMYVFGGSNGVIHAASNEFEVLYNDLWAYDFNTDLWSSVNAGGEIPSPRRQFGCTKTSGDVFAVFGGYGESGYLNDLYYFHEPSSFWFSVKSESVKPTGRSLACLAYLDNVFYIIGGRDAIKGFDEIWTYDFYTNEFILADAEYTLNKNSILDFNDCKCWVEKELDSKYLYVIGGTDYYMYPNCEIFKYTILSNNKLLRSSKDLGSLESITVIGSENSVIVTDSLIISLGGSLYNFVVIFHVLIYNKQTEELTIVEESFNFQSWGHSAVHYKDKIYIFGGGGITDIYKSSRKIFNNLYSLQLESIYNLGCSKGTYGKHCTPCPAGTYFLDNDCVKCSKGRYSTLLASTSAEQCMPCAANTFNNKLGARYCLDCPGGSSCPIGSESPKYDFSFPSNNSVQPSEYKSESEFVNEKTSFLWYLFAGFTGIICLLGITVKKFWFSIQKIDLFVDYHANELELPVVYKKTSCGGLFSFIFIVVSLITVVIGILGYTINNITEIRALIPVIALGKEIKAEIVEIKVGFYIYGGSCVVDEKCSPLIDYQNQGFEYDMRKVSCKLEKEVCQVSFEYENLKLKGKNSEIFIGMKEKLSFASGIFVNITSSSSIPNEISSILTYIKPESTQTLFRGTTPSKFYYKFIPSTFKSDSNKWPASETGFHVSVDKEPVAGSVALRETLNLNIHLLVRIYIFESETALQTQRNVNQSFYLFAGTILGSVFGLMGTFGSIMAFTENFSLKIERKKLFKIQMRKLASVVNKLDNEFGPDEISHKSSKVFPFSNITDSTIH